MESIKCEFADIEHKIYLHQKFIRLFVVDIYVKMNPATLGGGTITMNYPKWESSGDLTFGSPLNYRGNWYKSCMITYLSLLLSYLSYY